MRHPARLRLLLTQWMPCSCPSLSSSRRKSIHCGRRKRMFLLDVKYNPQNSTITRWIKDGSDCKPVREVFYPKIYVSGEHKLLPLIASLPGVKNTCFDEKRTWLGQEPEKVISVTLEPNSV
jgi:hypothetical protein